MRWQGRQLPGVPNIMKSYCAKVLTHSQHLFPVPLQLFCGCRYSLPFLLSSESWCISATQRLKKKKKNQDRKSRVQHWRQALRRYWQAICLEGVISRWIWCRNHIPETDRWKHGSWYSLNFWLRQICVYQIRINTDAGQNCSPLVPAVRVWGLSI